jgi:hypothetical protein
MDDPIENWIRDKFPLSNNWTLGEIMIACAVIIERDRYNQEAAKGGVITSNSSREVVKRACDSATCGVQLPTGLEAKSTSPPRKSLNRFQIAEQEYDKLKRKGDD